MKPKHIIAVIILGAILVLCFFGCFLIGVSIDDRLSQFIGDLNKTDRTSIYKNFHPTATTDYAAIRDQGYINTWFPTTGLPGTQYTITGIDSSKSSRVTAAISGPSGIWTPSPVNVYFVMEKDGNDWMIAKIYANYPSSWQAIVP
jgi:hypothetical protein